ncbi:MAG TPA: energy transducer TonB [Nitrospiria bacterium]|jgi:protein TonB|nr:energy transducer TonB [Nitrospiria bacterium]
MPGYVGFKKKKSKVGTTLLIVAVLHLAAAGFLVWLATTSIGQEFLAYYKINIRNVKEPEPPKPKPPEPEPPKPEPPPPAPEPEAAPPPVEDVKSAPPPPATPAPVELPGFGNPFASGAGGGKYSGYIDLVTTEIQRLYKQPQDLPENISLSVVLQLQVDEAGTLLDYQLVGSSGNPKFDQSALRAISELKKLRPPPAGMSRKIVVKFIPPS